ncbi:hypothetical protein ZWY2020_059863 [Hordeum vulgare]|nr:hypothetical protein ZWY2020_059863 [Hordeum vulgare]
MPSLRLRPRQHPLHIRAGPETDYGIDSTKLLEAMQADVEAGLVPTACICPEFRHHLDGVERVDSISVSPHKWLLTCLDCTCLYLYVRDAHRLSDSMHGHQPRVLQERCYRIR